MFTVRDHFKVAALDGFGLKDKNGRPTAIVEWSETLMKLGAEEDGTVNPES